MEQPTATRSELLGLRTQLALANRGRELLEDKRDKLMDEFRRVAGSALAGEGELEQAAADARGALARAEALDGPDRVRSAAAAGRSSIELHTKVTTLMGVRIADIQQVAVGRGRLDRGTGAATTSPLIDRAAEGFEVELELLLQHANLELRLRRLAQEISATTRRVNALEFAVIPQLQAGAAAIQSVLDERERQDRFRLKRIKERKARAAS
jgi:V/A-type H+-transporting ATPase subunit D